MELSWYRLAPTPITKAGQQAYREGRCAICSRAPHRAGDLACDTCHSTRLARAHRVHAALAGNGLAPWPVAVPSTGDALRYRYPLLVLDEDDVATAGEAPDYTAAADAVLLAAREQTAPGCPVCGRKPAKGAVVHVGCRRNLLVTLADRPFTKPRNAAFQTGRFTVCRARPYEPHGIACDHCAHLLRSSIEEVDAAIRAETSR